MIRLGVNVDHVATVREARRTYEPDPVRAAHLAEMGGADQITVHLREDRRHIKERDLRLLRETVTTRLNLEMALSDEIIAVALEVRPDQVTLVPEKRQEITTEGGLDAAGLLDRVKAAVARFHEAGIFVSLFIDPEPEQIRASAEAGADAVELHTGEYANAPSDEARGERLEQLRSACELAHELGLQVVAGHGLTYTNIRPVTKLPHLEEVNIGHTIVSRAIYEGIETAVRRMKELLG